LDWNQFDGQRAFAHVEKMIAFGPRPSGSDALQKTQRYIVDELQKLGLRVEEQEFTADTLRGKIAFKNIIAWLDCGHDVIVLGSHYETKWFQEFEFVGANDAGSSTGALLELARVLAGNRAALRSTICFVFFDGEEAFEKYSATDGFYGSRHLVREWKRDGTLARVKAMILWDMIGDRDLTITIPEDCDPSLTRLVFQAADALGVRDHFGLMRGNMQDDHTAFAAEGVPAVDLIDFEFGSRPRLNDFWHTPQDTLDKITARSLQTVGKVTLKTLAELDGAPSARR
jgi:Zn-dependent M28 family amino/carboxypeptidase